MNPAHSACRSSDLMVMHVDVDQGEALKGKPSPLPSERMMHYTR